MKKIIRFEGLDCAACAAKIESTIRKIEGVQSANVSFISQKLFLEAEEGQLNEVLLEIKKIFSKIEPDCRILG